MPGASPSSLGFRMPAEWHPHESTWLAWPKDPTTWPGRVEAVRETFIRMIRELVTGERVDLLVDDTSMREEVSARLRREGVGPARIRLHLLPTVDAWIRDYGPLFIMRRDSPQVAYVDWRFNAWGGRYPELLPDGQIPARLEPTLGFERFRAEPVLEGGAIDVNGRGLALATEQCLLHPNRNPALRREDMEQALDEFLGVKTVLWLAGGISGDDTDGHVDQVARFVAPDTVVCARERDPQAIHFAVLEENRKRLEQVPGLRLIDLLLPRAAREGAPPRPASYCNFYIANRVVLVPTFQDPADGKALDRLRELFPGRRVVGIDSRDLILGSGALHCLTQQQPAPAGSARLPAPSPA